MLFGQENERGVSHPSTARLWRFRFPSPNVTLWVKISWLIHSNRSPTMCIQSNLQAQSRCDLCINRGEISSLQHVFSSNLFYSSSYMLIWLTLGFFSLIWSPASVPPSSRLGSCGSGRPGTLNAVGSSCGSICFWIRWRKSVLPNFFFFVIQQFSDEFPRAGYVIVSLERNLFVFGGFKDSQNLCNFNTVFDDDM